MVEILGHLIDLEAPVSSLPFFAQVAPIPVQPAPSVSVQSLTATPKVWASPEGIAAIGTCASALFGFLALASLWYLRRQLVLLTDQIKGDHERSRRERTIDLMMAFSNSQVPTDKVTQFSIRLIYELNRDQVEKLWSRDEFTVTPHQQLLLDQLRLARRDAANFCPSAPPASVAPAPTGKAAKANANKTNVVTVTEAIILRAIAANQLNRLEIIATAWRHHIADREIIQNEFKRVFCPKDGVYVLQYFRDASQIYPSVNEICAFFENKRKSDGAVAKQPIV